MPYADPRMSQICKHEHYERNKDKMKARAKQWQQDKVLEKCNDYTLEAIYRAQTHSATKISASASAP